MIAFKVSKDFEKKFEQEVRNVLVKPLNRATDGIKEELLIDTRKFRGRSTGTSIADESALASETSSKVKTPFTRVFPISGMLEVFGQNAQGFSSPQILHREEDPGWFNFNNIKGDSVIVRNRQNHSGVRPPLGSKQRQFFDNAFTRLSNGKIIDIMEKQ